MEKYIQLQVTFPHRESATELAAVLVEKRLVACSQVVGPIESHYIWKGEQRVAREYLLLAKARSERFEEIAEFIRCRHSYETPQIAAADLVAITPDYEDWLRNQTE